MQVHVEHRVDVGDEDDQGFVDYHYEYDIFEFSEAGVVLTARSYLDAPHEAHFVRIASASTARRLTDKDMRSRLAADAITHLRALGKRELRWLSGRGNGYEPVTSVPPVPR